MKLILLYICLVAVLVFCPDSLSKGVRSGFPAGKTFCVYNDYGGCARDVRIDSDSVLKLCMNSRTHAFRTKKYRFVSDNIIVFRDSALVQKPSDLQYLYRLNPFRTDTAYYYPEDDFLYMDETMFRDSSLQSKHWVGPRLLLQLDTIDVAGSARLMEDFNRKLLFDKICSGEVKEMPLVYKFSDSPDRTVTITLGGNRLQVECSSPLLDRPVIEIYDLEADGFGMLQVGAKRYSNRKGCRAGKIRPPFGALPLDRSTIFPDISNIELMSATVNRFQSVNHLNDYLNIGPFLFRRDTDSDFDKCGLQLRPGKQKRFDLYIDNRYGCSEMSVDEFYDLLGIEKDSLLPPEKWLNMKGVANCKPMGYDALVAKEMLEIEYSPTPKDRWHSSVTRY